MSKTLGVPCCQCKCLKRTTNTKCKYFDNHKYKAFDKEHLLPIDLVVAFAVNAYAELLGIGVHFHVLPLGGGLSDIFDIFWV